MPTIQIRQPLKGLTTHYTSVSSGLEGREHEYTKSDGIDLFAPGFYGHISPARIFDQQIATANINSIIRAIATDPSQTTPYVYLFTGGLNGIAPRWIRLINNASDNANVITLGGGHGSHNFTTIPTSGTGFWGEDIILYKVASVNYLFMSYSDNSDGDVCRLTLVSTGLGTQVDDFMSATAAGGAVLATNVPHRMEEGSDGKLYITGSNSTDPGRYVAQFDGANGANGTYDPTKYDCGKGWVAVDIRPWKGFLVVLMVKMGPTYRVGDYTTPIRVCFWNYTETGLGIVYDIDDGTASSLFVADNQLYLFTQGRNYTGKLRVFDGSRFKILKEWPVAVYGTIPQPKSIEYYLGNIVWIPGDVTGPNVMGYDATYDALHVPYLLNFASSNATTGTANAGVLKNFFQGNLYFGGLFGATYVLVMLNASATYASSRNFRDLLRRIPYKATITKIRVYLSQMASGSSIQVGLFRNYVAQSMGTAGTDLLAGKNATRTFAADGALTEFEIPNINAIKTSSFYLNLLLTGQISVPLVEVEWEPYGSGA